MKCEVETCNKQETRMAVDVPLKVRVFSAGNVVEFQLAPLHLCDEHKRLITADTSILKAGFR